MYVAGASAGGCAGRVSASARKLVPIRSAAVVQPLARLEVLVISAYARRSATPATAFAPQQMHLKLQCVTRGLLQHLQPASHLARRTDEAPPRRCVLNGPRRNLWKTRRLSGAKWPNESPLPHSKRLAKPCCHSPNHTRGPRSMQRKAPIIPQQPEIARLQITTVGDYELANLGNSHRTYLADCPIAPSRSAGSTAVLFNHAESLERSMFPGHSKQPKTTFTAWKRPSASWAKCALRCI